MIDPADAIPQPTRARATRPVLWARAGSALVFLLTILSAPVLAQSTSESSSSSEPLAFTQNAINPQLPPLDDPPNLETPLASLENLVISARKGDFARAAHSLNFRLANLPEPNTQGPDAQAIAALEAERFWFILSQELWIDWDTLPDRPDGQPAPPFGEPPGSTAPTRSILIGRIDLGNRSVPVRVSRYTSQSTEPVWLISDHTVEHIDALYQQHGPGWLDQRMPEWARGRAIGGVILWKLIALGLALVIAPWVGLATARLVRTLAAKSPLDRDRLAKFDWPIATVAATAVVWITLEWLISLPSAIAAVSGPVVLVVMVGAIVWLVMRVLNDAVDRIAARAGRSEDGEVSPKQRRLLTQIAVARHLIVFIVALAGLGLVMLQLDIFRTVGVALLSSAGAAAVVLGIASHAVLGNLVAGLQIALTRPFTLEDTVYIEDNWGKIEDITYTFVVVRTWDDRRLVFPISYFTREWFENWSLTDTFTTKPIYLKVDLRAPVDEIREKFIDLVKSDEHWAGDPDEPKALVTDMDHDCVTVRLTAGGADPSSAWSLRCRVHEQMLDWLRDQHDGAYLPRERILLTRSRERDHASVGDDRND